MSRRKQSNPKPAKRDSDFDEIAALVQLPSHQLYIKESEEDCAEYTIHAKTELKAGTFLGKYKGQLRDQSAPLDDGRTSLLVNRSDGQPLRVMLEDEGHWLKLMSVAATPADANICLQISGSDVLCTVTSDIAREVELRVTCRIADQDTKSNWTSLSSSSCPSLISISEDSEQYCRYSPRSDEDGNPPGTVVDISETPNEMLDHPDPGNNIFCEEGDLGGGDDVVVGMPTESSPIGSTTCKSEPVSEENNSSLPEGLCEDRETTKDQSSTDSACDPDEVKSPGSAIVNDSPPVGDQVRAICRGVDSTSEGLDSKRTCLSDDDEADRHCREVDETECALSEDKDSRAEDDLASSRKNSGRCFQCPHCPYFSYRHYVYARHLKTHNSTSSVSTSSPSETSALSSNPVTHMDRYCRACSIQFMSVKTYQVHKQFYCNSRHESSRSPTEMDLMHLGDTSSNDDVISASNNAICMKAATLPTGGAPVIQPQAIFAAISTNPLILLPCSVINGQVVVPQNGIIPTGTGLVVPTAISGTNVVNSSSVTHLLRQAETSSVLDIATSAFKTDNTSSPSIPPLPVAHGVKPITPCSVKEAPREGDGPGRQKSHSVINPSADHLVVSKKAKAEPKSLEEEYFITSQQNTPLDLSVRKRKISSPCIQNPVSVVKRRNSSASSSTSSPPISSYSHLPTSPGAYGVDRLSSSSSHSARTSSPVLLHSDASSSSVACSSMKNSSIPGRCSPCGSSTQGACSTIERVSPHPPVLHSGVETSSISHRIVHISAPPAKLMKQGNNMCKECNIVFYKYDNYLAHKRHYCAYRRRHVAANSAINHVDTTMSSDEGNKLVETINEPFTARNAVDESARTIHCGRPIGRVEFGMEMPSNVGMSSTGAGVSKTHVPVYRCNVCGVKFSTLDNLNAHQTYYCSRQGDMSIPKPSGRATPPKKCRRARDNNPGPSYDEVSQESLDLPDEWKCNYCEIVCPSLKAARRHLLTHTEIRGFCCIICGYRGNTLRGMRNHIYGHLSVDNGQIEDLLASSVVVDPSGSAVHSQSSDYSDEETYTTRRGEGKVRSPLGRVESYRDLTLRPKSSASPVSPSLESSTNKQHSDSHQPSESPEMHVFGCQFCDFSSSDQEGITDHISSHHEKAVQDSERDAYYPGDVSYNAVSGEGNEILNASSICDVVIKAEDETEERIVPDREYDESSLGCPAEGHLQTKIKEEPLDKDECEMRREDKESVSSGSPTSVICKTRISVLRENTDSSEGLAQEGHTSGEFPHQVASKEKQERCVPKSELKYCKSCDISFHHLSNFIAHKKYYCVPRVVRNFQQETAPVQ